MKESAVEGISVGIDSGLSDVAITILLARCRVWGWL